MNSWFVLFIFLVSLIELSLGCPLLSGNTCIGNDFGSGTGNSILINRIKRRDFVRERTRVAKKLGLPLRLNVTIGMGVDNIFKKYETRKDSPAGVRDTNEEQSRKSNQEQKIYMCDWRYRAIDPKVPSKPNIPSQELIAVRNTAGTQDQGEDRVYSIQASYGGSIIHCQCEPVIHEITTLEFQDCTRDSKEEKWVLTTMPVTVGFVCVKKVS